MERELAQRLAARKRTAEQQQRERARAEQEQERQRQAAEVQSLKDEAAQRSEAVQALVQELESVLLDRPGDLGDYRRKAEQRLLQEGPQAFADAVGKLLLHSPLPPGCRPAVRAAYAPEAKQLLLEVDLPGQGIIPQAAGYRFIAQRREVVPQPRKDTEARDLYRRLVARLALHAIEEGFAVTSPDLVDTVLFNGHADAKDRATGRPVRPCLASVVAEREAFCELDLGESELDPALCLRHLNAIVSPHPYDLPGRSPRRGIRPQQVPLRGGGRHRLRPRQPPRPAEDGPHRVRAPGPPTLRSHRTGSLDHPGQPRRRRPTPSPSTATP
ncbi:hypothetical protein [Streptacidiphilus sp. PAMC 29251]